MWTCSSRLQLIRHGEKVDDETVGLSPQGEERAQCVKNYFSHGASEIE